jgi:hypothetical protein
MKELAHTNRASLQDKVEGILAEDTAPVLKLRFLMALGLDEEEAELLVDRHQSGSKQPIYYEELTPYAEDDEFLHS